MIDATKIFLEKYPLTKEEQKKIINCVEAHHKGVKFNCVEAEICANADCYRFLHPKMNEKHKILSLDICKKELEPYYQEFKKLFEKASEK